MKNQDKNNIASIKYIATNIFSCVKNTRCGLDVSLKLSPVLYFLYKNHLNINPKKPKQFNRDRLFFSQGHAAPVLYSVLYHFGYDISEKDLKTYSAVNSKLPMIPDYTKTPGVDATTYPLGQDIGQATGLALAQKFVKKKLDNQIDPYTYVLCIDETLQNGYTYESMSFAGHFKLNNLIVLNVGVWKEAENYKMTFSDNLKARAKGSQWKFIQLDMKKLSTFEDQLNDAISTAKKSQKPTLINIEVGMAKEAAFEELMCYLKPMDNQTWESIEQKITTSQKRFKINADVKNDFKKIIKSKKISYKKWNDKVGKKLQTSSKFKKLLKQDRSKIDLTKHFKTCIGKEQMVYSYQCHCIKLSTVGENSLLRVQEFLSENIPSYIDGTGEVLNVGIMKGVDTTFGDIYQKNIVYGVRDGVIPSIVSGMTYFEGLNSAFFIDTNWVDYVLPGLKSSAILKQNTLTILNYVFAEAEQLSEYHQLVEQTAILRATPNLVEWRPIDAHEALLSYQMYLEAKNHPTVILLRNEVVKTMSNVSLKDFSKGAYILKKEKTKDFKTLICSGGEMEYVLQAFNDRKDIRIVSMPSVSTFRKQTTKFKKMIIPNKLQATYIEVGNDRSMYEFADRIIGIRDYIYQKNTKSVVLSVSKLKKLFK